MSNFIKDMAKTIQSIADNESDPDVALATIEHTLANFVFLFKTENKKFKAQLEDNATEIVVDNVRKRLVNYTPSTN